MQKAISEKEFMADYERCKQIADLGINGYFILMDNQSFRQCKEIGNTTLDDIESVFGDGYISMFRFADVFQTGTGLGASSLRIRRNRNSDVSWMRSRFRMIPKKYWVCEWADNTGNVLLLPFVQEPSADIRFLDDMVLYALPHRRNKHYSLPDNTPPKMMSKRIVELLPDYADSLLAITKYKNIDMIVPIEKKSAKRTFRNREKEEGVKRHLIHEVQRFERKNLKKVDSVKPHLRGQGELSINGIDVTLCASWEMNKYI